MSQDPIDELLAACLDSPESERTRRIEQECSTNPGIADELRRRYRKLVELGMIEAPRGELERLGPFRLLRRLGRGGMGVVWLAEDTELGRQVALKLVRPDLLDSEKARLRFRREAEAAAKLDHPGICTVYGAGEIDGQPFLALRYLDGETLEQRLRAARAGDHGVLGGESARRSSGSGRERLRPVDLRPALQLVEQLARALHAAHEHGLVHRDVKPGNVMVDADDQPVLMDFGLARDTESSAANLTQTSETIGTPAYMAPEQIRGAGPIDRRTDVYALGAVLYECLTLRTPFSGRSREELYRSILQGEPIDLRRLQPAASRDLATVVHKALAKEPRRRYASALHLAEDLHAALDGRPTAARPPGPATRVWRWANRNRAAAAVAAAVLLGLASSLLLLDRSRAAERRHFAVAEITRADAARHHPEQAMAILRAAFEQSREPELVAAINALLPELQRWELVETLGSRIETLVSSPSGRWHLASGVATEAVVLDRTGAVRHRLLFCTPQMTPFAFSPDEDELLVVRYDERPNQRLVRCTLDGDEPLVESFPNDDERRGQPRAVAWGREHIVVVYLAQQKARAVGFDRVGNERFAVELPERCFGVAVLADGRIALPSGIYDAADDVLVGFGLTDLADDPIRRVAAAGGRIALGSDSGLRIVEPDGHVHDHRRPTVMRGSQLRWIDAAADGAFLATFNDGLVQLLLPEGRVEPWHERRTTWLARFSSNGQRILTADWGGRVTIRDRQGLLRHQWQGHRDAAHAAWLQDGTGRVLTAGWDATLKLWSPGVFPGLPLRSGFGRAVAKRAGDLLVVADSDGRLLALDADGELVQNARAPAPGIAVLHRHRDGRSVWVGEFEDRGIQAWDPESAGFGVRREFAGSRGPVSVAPLASGQLLAAFGLNPRMQVIDTASPTGRQLDGIEAAHVAASAGGRVAVTIDGRGLLRIHDGATADAPVLRELVHPDIARTGNPPSRASCLAMDDRGTRAAIGRRDGAVELWNLETGRLTADPWRRHETAVRAIDLSSDGRHVASVTSAGHLVIHESGRDAPALDCHLDDENLVSVAFFQGAAVTTGWRRSGVLRWWWWNPERLAARLEQLPRPK